MNETVKWGGTGVLLALLAAAAIGTELQHALAHGDMLTLGYGVAVVAAALLVVLVVAPAALKGR